MGLVLVMCLDGLSFPRKSLAVKRASIQTVRASWRLCWIPSQDKYLIRVLGSLTVLQDHEGGRLSTGYLLTWSKCAKEQCELYQLLLRSENSRPDLPNI